MISEKLGAKLVSLLNGEIKAHYIYLQTAAWASGRNLDGCKTFLLGHAAEELGHMRRIFDYLDDVGTPIAFDALAKPQVRANSVRELFLQIQDEEKSVTQGISEAIDLARAEHSHSTDQFLQWFAAEQHEEEKLCKQIIDKLDLIGEGPNSLYLFDRELAALANQN